MCMGSNRMKICEGRPRRSFLNIRILYPSTRLPKARDWRIPGIHFVTVAQAFHWFDRQRFRAECKRILKEKGKVVLLWNMRDETSGLVRENEEIDRIYCPDFKGFSVGMGGESPEKYGDFFKDGICEYNVFPNDLVFDEEGFIGRNLSASYSPKVGEEKYQPYLSALKRLFAKYSNSGYLSMPNFTRTYVGEV